MTSKKRKVFSGALYDCNVAALAVVSFGVQILAIVFYYVSLKVKE